MLYKRLARQSDWSKQPRLDGAGLKRIARGFSVTHEKRSTTRYVADVTYVFTPSFGTPLALYLSNLISHGGGSRGP